MHNRTWFGNTDNLNKGSLFTKFDRWFVFTLLFTGILVLGILFSLAKFWTSSGAINFTEISVIADQATHSIKNSLKDYKDSFALSQVLLNVRRKYPQIDNLAIILRDSDGRYKIHSDLGDFPSAFKNDATMNEYFSSINTRCMFTKNGSDAGLIMFIPLDINKTDQIGYLACRFPIKTPISLVFFTVLVVFWILSTFLLILYYRHNRLATEGLLDEQERSRQKAREQALFMETLLDTIPAPVFYKDTNGVYLGCNHEFARGIVGVSPDEIIGCKLDELKETYPQDLVEKIRIRDKELLDNPGIQRYECKIHCSDGQRREFKFKRATFLDTDGSIGGIVGVMLDISRQKNIEKKLRRSEYMAQCLLNASRDIALLIDPLGKIMAANQAMADLVQIDCHRIPGNNLYDLFPANISEIYMQNIRQSIALKRPREFMVCYNNRLYNTLIYPANDIGNDEIENLAMFSRDVTDHINQLETLKRSDEMTRTLLNARDEMAVLVDREGIILFINETGAGLLNISPEDAVGTALHYHMPPEISDYRLDRLRKVAETGQSVHFQDSMNERWYENRIFPVTNEFDKVSRIAFYSCDITEMMELSEAKTR